MCEKQNFNSAITSCDKCKLKEFYWYLVTNLNENWKKEDILSKTKPES